MKNILKITFALFVFQLSIFQFLTAQVGINTDGSEPDASAMLDVKSSDKGVLIPRLSSTERQQINEPAIGLMVYDSTAQAFYYFNGMGWLELLSNSVTLLEDSDGDTKIQVEEIADEDIIRFDIAGTEFMRLDSGRIEILNTKGNISIGEDAGKNTDYLNGSNNIFIGEGAGEYSTTASLNVAVGTAALETNSIGSSNVALGYLALRNNTDGSDNIAVGRQALQSGNGDRNTAVGTFSLRMDNFSATLGSNNTAFGYQAGNSFLGNNSLLLGYQAGKNKNGDNKLYIANSDTASPLIYGEFDNNLLRVNGILNVNNAFSFPTIDGLAGKVLETDGAGNIIWGDKTVNSDDQQLLLSSTILAIEDGNSVDLASIDTDTDDQNIDVLSLNGTMLEISLADDGEATKTLDLAGIDTDTDDQNIDVLSLNGTNLEISLVDDDEATKTLDLASIDTDTDDQNIDVLSLNGTNLEISLVDDGEATKTLDLASIDTDTDDQNIDVLSLNGTNLEISLANDGEATKTLDLSSINSIQALVEDADGDTKIQVEESADEDVIRFDVNGMEVASINSGGQMGIGKTALTRLDVDMGQLANERLMIEQNIGTTSFNTNVTGWQSFTTEYSGDLSLVSVRHTFIASTNKFVRIYEGEGTAGNLLYDSSAENIVSAGWTDFVIAGVSLVEGQQYSIWLNDAEGWQFSGSNPYPQGIFKNNSSRDARFRVFVENSDISFQVDDNLLVVGSYSLPVIDGVDGQALVTDGNGNVSWQSAVPVGTIQMWVTDTPPAGWLICDGSSFDTNQYPALQTILNSSNVPDLRRRFPLGAQDIVNPGETPRPLSSTGGEEEVTLTIAQMPAHTHGIQYREGEEQGNGNDYSDLGDTGVNDSTQPTGGGEAHNNMPPYYALHFIIRAE